MAKKRNFIQVFEYQTLRFDNQSSFQEHHFNAMVKFNELNENKYFTIVHKGVRFCNYVGVIQIGGLTIEILPKADNNEQTDKNLWQSVLLNMLRECHHIQIDTLSESQLRKRNNSILDVYFELYLNEVERITKKGLIRRYRIEQKNQNALKGKLLFSSNIQHNLIHKERFYCEHQVYDKNHLLHQILLRALLVLKSFINDSLRDKLNRLLFEFKDFDLINIDKSHLNKITFDRKNIDYKNAFEIAKILILNYSPNLNYGSDNLLTLLFDMNVLWEEYIFRILNKHKPEGMQVSFQNSEKFWENKRIRPDIVVQQNKQIYIIDTKWKIVDSKSPADADLKQMFTYNLHWKAEKSLLLYPKVKQSDSDFGKFHYQTSEGNSCKIGFIELTDGKNIKSTYSLCQDILEKLETQNYY